MRLTWDTTEIRYRLGCVIIVAGIYAFVVHLFGWDWFSNVLLTISGFSLSAWLTIYTIEKEIFSRYHTARPTLKRIRREILILSRNLAINVVKIDRHDPIFEAINDPEENASPDDLRKLNDKITAMRKKEEDGEEEDGEGLSEEERKRVQESVCWSSNKIEAISSKIDHVVDLIPKDAEKFSDCSEYLNLYAPILREIYTNWDDPILRGIYTDRYDDLESIESHVLRIYGVVLQLCIGIYEIVIADIAVSSSEPKPK